jgi:hypothetical protein
MQLLALRAVRRSADHLNLWLWSLALLAHSHTPRRTCDLALRTRSKRLPHLLQQGGAC